MGVYDRIDPAGTWGKKRVMKTPRTELLAPSTAAFFETKPTKKFPDTEVLSSAAAGFFETKPTKVGAPFQDIQILPCTVDAKQFRKDCRAPLFPGRWNVWRIFRSTIDNASERDAVRMTENVVRTWFKKADLGEIDHIKVTHEEWSDFKRPEGTSVVKGRNDCIHPILLRGLSYRNLLVRFIYRGSAGDMPWPTWRISLTDSWCPVDADYFAETIYSSPDEHVPDQPKRITDIDIGDLVVPATAGIVTYTVVSALVGLAALYLLLKVID